MEEGMEKMAASVRSSGRDTCGIFTGVYQKKEIRGTGPEVSGTDRELGRDAVRGTGRA